jgi:hypothetical protein
MNPKAASHRSSTQEGSVVGKFAATLGCGEIMIYKRQSGQAGIAFDKRSGRQAPLQALDA